MTPTTERPQLERKTDSGNAQFLADLFKDELRWVPEWKSWIFWDGKRWQKDTNGRHILFSRRAVREMLKQAEQLSGAELAELSKHAAKSESLHSQKAMVELAKPLLAVNAALLDANPYLFNCLNGTVDLRTGERREHSPSDFITKLAPVEFSPEAICPAFDAFFTRIMPNANIRGYLQRFLGYSLSGDVSEQCLGFWRGDGANGKSTLFGVILQVMGDYAMVAEPSLLLSTDKEKHSTDRADLEGMRFAVCSEVEYGRAISESMVKQLTGGDPVKARLLYENNRTITATWKIIIVSNPELKIRTTDNGIWRRVHKVPFAETIQAHEKDPHLKEKLLAEAPGILTWMVRGCLAWQRDGLSIPKEITEATKSYREEQDVLRPFTEECLIEDSRGFVPNEHMYSAYSAWCTKHGETPYRGNGFRDALRDRGYTQGKFGGKRGWFGVRRRTATGNADIAAVGLDSGHQKTVFSGNSREENSIEKFGGKTVPGCLLSTEGFSAAGEGAASWTAVDASLGPSSASSICGEVSQEDRPQPSNPGGLRQEAQDYALKSSESSRPLPQKKSESLLFPRRAPLEDVH